jgi:chemotaxis protein MotA
MPFGSNLARFLKRNCRETHFYPRRRFMMTQVLLSAGLLASIFFLAFQMEVKTLGVLSNINALIIVIGGTCCATLLAYPASKIYQSFKYVVASFRSDHEPQWTIKTLVGLARASRKDGLHSLDRKEDALPEGLIRTGVGLIAYQFNRKNIEQVLRKEALHTYSQYETAHKILYSMARVAPAMGLAGTVMNLIRMFSQIDNPQNLIGFMAVALLSTLYGVVLANLGFLPLCNKLKEFMDQDLLRMEIIEEGILDIYDQEHPRAMEYKLERLAGIRTELIPPAISLAQTPAHAERING